MNTRFCPQRSFCRLGVERYGVKGCLAIIVIGILRASSAQSTTQFGFEEFQLKDTPPFVTGVATVENRMSSLPYLQIPPFEGQNMLVGAGIVLIESPNREPIKSFTVHLFLPRTSMPPWYASVGNGAVQQDLVGGWQTIEGSYDSPVQNIRISAFYGTEFIRGDFAIDAIEFTTIPEPQTFWLLTIGLISISSRAPLKRPKPNRA